MEFLQFKVYEKALVKVLERDIKFWRSYAEANLKLIGSQGSGCFCK
jgi:hypothetical protein